MKHCILFIALFCILFSVFGTVFADETLPNPSLYSASGMVPDLPGFWWANYIEIQEYLKGYPDLQCEHYSNSADGSPFDQIVCSSVNNSRARDVIINFYFTGDHAGMTGLQEVVFTIGTPETKDFQEVLEKFWHPEAFPWHFETDEFYYKMPSILFYTGNTMIRFDIPNFNSEYDIFTTVDFWDANAGRLAVG